MALSHPIFIAVFHNKIESVVYLGGKIKVGILKIPLLFYPS